MGYWNCLNDLGEINYVVGRDLGREDPEHLEIEIQSWRLWFQEEDTVRKTKEWKYKAQGNTAHSVSVIGPEGGN